MCRKKKHGKYCQHLRMGKLEKSDTMVLKACPSLHHEQIIIVTGHIFKGLLYSEDKKHFAHFVEWEVKLFFFLNLQ